MRLGAQYLMQSVRAALAPLLAAHLLAVGDALHAQGAPPGRADLTAERHTRVRWMHGSQQPRFTVFRDARHWVHIDSVVAGERSRGRTLHLRLESEQLTQGAVVTLHVSAAGAWLRASAALTTALPPARVPLDTVRYRRLRLLDEAQELSLPEARLWGLVPTVRPARLEPGLRWIDTLDLATDQDGFRQSLRGVRVSVVLGDTLIDGRRFYLIGDSARVLYQERVLQDEATLDAVAVVDRAAQGTLRGRHVYDAALGLSLVRHDTTVLAGEALLQYPDGRAFRTPARYEAFGSWTLRDSVSHQRHRDALRREAESHETGMVQLPVGDLERAVDRDDPGVRDSVLARWERTMDPDEYARLFRVLWWGGERLRRAVQERRVAAGDTAFALESLPFRSLGYGHKLDLEELQRWLPFLENPGMVFAYGGDREHLFHWIIDGLTAFPPASIPDSTGWPCTPAACRLLAEQRHRGTEPRLRDIGLAAFATVDPARGVDTLLARGEKASSMLDRLRASAAVVLPAPGADWREWRGWVVHEVCLLNGRCRSTARVSVEASTTLRLHHARGTRDIAGEMDTRYRAESSDSARLVFGMLRLAFEREVSPDTIAAHIRSPSPPLRELGASALALLLAKDSAPRDSATALEVLDHYLAAHYKASPTWQRIDQAIAGQAPAKGPDSSALAPGEYFWADDLPPELKQKWAGRVPLISEVEWDALPQRMARSVTRVTVEKSFGPFALVHINTSSFLARREDQRVHAFASGHSAIIMKWGSNWVIVRPISTWIT